uniref:HTH-type transcriptional regulator SarZ n=1 Tax=Roseihalotalea indica TaxID=2867963 RepID=A0AA49GNI1_9BACT|nr:MarR family transcriptional regulator [Tunicatimonas sp. TK19036]
MSEVSHPSLKLENQICFPLYATSRLITKVYQPYLDELEITYPQYLVMLVLWEHDRKKVSEISHCLLLESNTLTPLLKRMEKKGLIRRTRSATDERSVIVELTDSGQQLKAEAATIPEKIVNTLQSDQVKHEDITHLQHTLSNLIPLLLRASDESQA